MVLVRRGFADIVSPHLSHDGARSANVPVAEARKQARYFLTACTKAAYMAEVETSCELPNGGIAFAMRRGFALRSDRAAPRPVGAVTPILLLTS